MPEYKLQRFRGGWAIALYEDGKRVSRKSLEARDAAGAAAEFSRITAAASRPVDPNVAEVWDAYVADKDGRRIAKNMRWSRTNIVPFFGAMRPDDITPKVCRTYTAKRRALGKKDATIRTELNQLRTAMLWAEKHKMIAKAPFMEMPSAGMPRERRLTRGEFDRLLAAAAETPHLRLYLLLAIATAGRNAALVELTWDRVDFNRGLIILGVKGVVRPMKGRATVSMNDELRAALSAAKPHALTDRVIEFAGRPVAGVRTSLSKAAENAGLVGVSPHVLRHSAACWMAEDGISMQEIAAMLGHSDTLITQRVYAQLSPGYLRTAAQSLQSGRRPATKL